MRYIQMYREIRSERQKLMKISWEREKEITNILNKKILKYHFLSCIYIYIKFQNMFHSSDHEKREREFFFFTIFRRVGNAG